MAALATAQGVEQATNDDDAAALAALLRQGGASNQTSSTSKDAAEDSHDVYASYRRREWPGHHVKAMKGEEWSQYRLYGRPDPHAAAAAAHRGLTRVSQADAEASNGAEQHDSDAVEADPIPLKPQTSLPAGFITPAGAMIADMTAMGAGGTLVPTDMAALAAERAAIAAARPPRSRDDKVTKTENLDVNGSQEAEEAKKAREARKAERALRRLERVKRRAAREGRSGVTSTDAGKTSQEVTSVAARQPLAAVRVSPSYFTVGRRTYEGARRLQGRYGVPTSHCAILRAADEVVSDLSVAGHGVAGDAAADGSTLIHQQGIAAMAISSSGARMVSGRYSGDMDLWDFSGMDRALEPFRTERPATGHFAYNFAYGDTHILACFGELCARVFTRDGQKTGVTKTGDVMIKDANNTKGHTGTVTGGLWRPRRAQHFFTAADDGTVRLWDVNTCANRHVRVYKLRGGRGGSRSGAASTARFRVSATALAYLDAPPSSALIVGCGDGSLQVYGDGGHTDRPETCLSGMHGTQRIMSVAVAPAGSGARPGGGTMVATRGEDDAVVLADLRRPDSKTPLARVEGLTSFCAQTPVAFSHDGRIVMTPCGPPSASSVQSGARVVPGVQGWVACIDVVNAGLVAMLPVCEAPIQTLVYHTELRQLLCGDARGNIFGLFSPDLSERGLLLSLAKQSTKRRHQALSTMFHGHNVRTGYDAWQERRQQRRERQSNRSGLNVPGGTEGGVRTSSSAPQKGKDGVLGASATAHESLEYVNKYSNHKQLMDALQGGDAGGRC